MVYPDDQTTAMSAKAWIDSLEQRWRVQILARRVRALPDGTKGEIPSRIRRFVEGAPWAFVKPAIDYLISKAPYSGVIANGVDFGVAYRPTLTMWQRDAQQAAVGAKGAGAGDATYTLVQDLVEADSDDVYVVGTSSSCSETVESRYVWDSASVEPIPQGGMGVTYQIAQVRRNEDGTFDYALVKRVALLQHTGPTVTESGALREVSVDLWDNVYVDPGGRYCDETMTPIPGFPEPGTTVGDDGTVVETKLSVSENPDCTLKVTATRERTLHVGVRSSSTHTQYEGEHEETELGRTEPLGLAPDASGGVIRRFETQMQPDGSFQATERTTVERPVPRSRVETSIGRRGVRVSVRDTNVRTAAGIDALAAGSESDATTVVIGGRRYIFGSVSSEKTPGGLFTNVVSTVDRRLPVDAGFRCEDSRFRHSHSVTVGGGDLGDVRATHVSGGSGGTVRMIEASIDDEGAVTKTFREDTEKPVEGSRVSYRVIREGTVRTQTDSSQGVRPAALGYSYGNVGRSTESTETDGGLFNNVRETPRRSGGSLPVSAAVSDTLEETVSSVDTVHDSQPSASTFTGVSVPRASTGVHRERTVRLTDIGTYVVSDRETKERETLHSERVRVTPRFTATSRTMRNAQTSGALSGMSGVVSETMWERTPGGRYNVTRTVASPSATPDSGHCERTVFEHRHDTVSFGSSIPYGDAPAPGGGHHYRRTFEVDEYGIVKTTVVRTDETPAPSAEVTYDRTAKGVRTTVVDRNQAAPVSPASEDRVYGTWKSTMNPGGSYDNMRSTFTPFAGANRKLCYRDAYTHEHTEGHGADASYLVSMPEAEGGSDGVYRAVEATLDDTGAVQVNEREVTELYVPDAVTVHDSDAFHDSVTVEIRSGDRVDPVPFVEGSRTKVTNTVTKGGKTDSTTVTETARPQVWDDELVTDLYVTYVFYFRNADGGLRASRKSDALNKWRELKDMYGGGNWAGGPRAPGSARISSSVNMNEYGLFDGHYTIELAWSPESGGGGNDHINNLVTLADWTYTLVDNQYGVAFTGGFGSGGYIEVSQTKSTKQIHESIVSGYGAYLNANFSGKTLIAGSHVSVTPSTGTAHGVVVTNATTSVHRFRGQDNADIWWAG